MERGHLRVYVGAAPGVGTTFAMLSEGLRRSQRGSDVVAVCPGVRGRPNTARVLDTLRETATVLPDLDVATVVARRPEVALVDDLAHTDTSGGRRVHRWQQVLELLDAGIDVVTTMKVAEIESLTDAVRTIVGTVPDATVPDEVLRRAEQIEMVDITPEAIRRRVAHGNVFAADALDLATLDLLNGSGFAELRALLMCWMADRLASSSDASRRAGSIEVRAASPRGDDQRWPGRGWLGASAIPPQRTVAGFVVAAAVLTALTIVLTSFRDDVPVSSALSLYLLAVVAIAALGGGGPAVLAAVASPLLVNWFLISPHHTLRIGDAQNVLSLVVFVSVALIVSRFVTMAAQRSVEAARLRNEAETLAALAGSAGPDPLASITEQLQESFALEGVSVLRIDDDGTATIEACSGPSPPSTIDDATFHETLAPGVVLAGRGRILTADDHRVLRSFVQQLSKAIEQHRLASIAEQAEALDRADELRTALLRAVSHDLRTPLAGIKASVSSLRQPDVDWPDEVREEFLAAIEADADRLTDIVVNLLDLSRLQAGALRPRLADVALDDVVSAALRSIGPRADTVDLEPDCADVDVIADPALLERVVANLIANALTWSPPHRDVQLRVHQRQHDVQLHVIDHGPGIRPRDRATVLRPFHRLDDSTSKGGLGLGLAIAAGLTEAMGATLELRDTPGGGLTAVVSMPGVPA